MMGKSIEWTFPSFIKSLSENKLRKGVESNTIIFCYSQQLNKPLENLGSITKARFFRLTVS
jgi:hypothetical protein